MAQPFVQKDAVAVRLQAEGTVRRIEMARFEIVRCYSQPGRHPFDLGRIRGDALVVAAGPAALALEEERALPSEAEAQAAAVVEDHGARMRKAAGTARTTTEPDGSPGVPSMISPSVWTSSRACERRVNSRAFTMRTSGSPMWAPVLAAR